MNNYDPQQETIRSAFHQFLGGVIQCSPNRESVVALIEEELVKIADDDIKPILKAAVYVMTIKYNKALEDAQKAFGKDNIPSQISNALYKDKHLIKELENYINKL
jgi:hypothetical protein